jgi:hypothetical protein
MSKAANKNVTVVPLTDVVLAVITTVETEPKTYVFETASNVSTEEVTKTTEEQSLEIKGTVYANKPSKTIPIGYNLTLTNNVFMPEIAALLTGGKVESTSSSKVKFTPPPVGTSPKKTKFRLDLYSEEDDEGGPTGDYLKVTFEGCEGSTYPIAMSDGSYFSNEMVIQSRPGAGKPPYTAEMVSKLPE